MTNQEVIAIVEKETGQQVTEATPIESLDVDSLELLDLLLAIENRGGANIPDDKLDEIHTVGDIVRLAL